MKNLKKILIDHIINKSLICLGSDAIAETLAKSPSNIASPLSWPSLSQDEKDCLANELYALSVNQDFGFVMNKSECSQYCNNYKRVQKHLLNKEIQELLYLASSPPVFSSLGTTAVPFCTQGQTN